jgi:predicted dehydrogenase
VKPLRLGVVGMSDGNGHPFSFSAIINGYSDEGMRDSGWPVIHDYLRRKSKADFGISGVRVTHAWTQDRAVTERLCRASLIEHAAADLNDLGRGVDAVVIARDDHETHSDMAMPFLASGLPVFVDKPLSLNVADLRAFKPYLMSGQLMSCSSVRYARELDAVRSDLASYGTVKKATGTIVNDWARYGIHMLEGIFSCLAARPVAVRSVTSQHDGMEIDTTEETVVRIDALGSVPKVFRIDIEGTRHTSTNDIVDNFEMFKRTLAAWVASIRTGVSAIPAEDTLMLMRTLIAGRLSQREQRPVQVSEVVI